MEIGDKVYSTFEHHQTGHDKFGREFRKIDGRTIVKKDFISAEHAPRGEDFYVYSLDNGNQIASFFCQSTPYLTGNELVA